jgi:hypothetical protein
VLEQGQEVGHALTRVVRVGERVDDRHREHVREAHHVFVPIGAGDERARVAAHDAAGVLDRLAAAEL